MSRVRPFEANTVQELTTLVASLGPDLSIGGRVFALGQSVISATSILVQGEGHVSVIVRL